MPGRREQRASEGRRQATNERLENAMKTLCAITLTLAAAAGTAHAAIVSTTGNAFLTGNPPVANFPAIINPNVLCWNEQTNVVVSSGVLVDMTVNPSSSTTPTPGVLVGTFNSHFMHWGTLPPAGASGTVTFDAPIVAVIFRDQQLDLSDPTFGSFGTVYPTGQFMRGMGNFGSVVSILGNTLTFNFVGSTAGTIDIEQVRVLTVPVPAPGAAALLGLGGLCVLRRRR
jgi:MYXO-CTERM domain-containing protein